MHAKGSGACGTFTVTHDASKYTKARLFSKTVEITEVFARYSTVAGESGDFPRWDFKVQIMPEKEAETYRFHPFNLSNVWSHKDYPLIDVGVFELNGNPENYHAAMARCASMAIPAAPRVTSRTASVCGARARRSMSRRWRCLAVGLPR